MNILKTKIPDVIIIKPSINIDERGYFMECFKQNFFNKTIGYEVNFIQENESQSKKGVLRGLHYQLQPYSQSKLVRVVKGSVLDVAVDLRKSSATFGHHVIEELNDTNKHQLFIPQGFAHGFIVLSEIAIISYRVDNYYSPEHERGIAFDDKQLNINWQLPLKEVSLSQKDINYPQLSDTKDFFT